MSCLFNSLAATTGVGSAVMRSTVCDTLSKGPVFLDGMVPLVDAAYIQKMRLPSTWGGGIEIQAICSIYNISIVICSTRHQDIGHKPIVFCPFGGLHVRTAYLTWDGSHYLPTKPLLTG